MESLLQHWERLSTILMVTVANDYLQIYYKHSVITLVHTPMNGLINRGANFSIPTGQVVEDQRLPLLITYRILQRPISKLEIGRYFILYDWFSYNHFRGKIANDHHKIEVDKWMR